MNEFDIIEQYFKKAHPSGQDELTLGIGDDAAILNIPDDNELIVSMDTLVSGIHFPTDTSPEDIGYKSLAVNISDIAAMGASPRWLLLSLTLPDYDDTWLREFSKGFNQLALDHSIILIGGDLSRGPLSVTVQITGIVPKGKSLYRSGGGGGKAIAHIIETADRQAGTLMVNSTPIVLLLMP